MSIQEKRRAKFEAWYQKEFEKETGRKMVTPLCEYRMGDNYQSGTYLDSCWIGWNAALDSVEVELPEPFEMDDFEGYDAPEVRAAIESAGVRVRQ